MKMLNPSMIRELTPACPPIWARLATLVVVAGTALVLVLSGVAVPDALMVLAAVCVLAAHTGVVIAAGRGLAALASAAGALTTGIPGRWSRHCVTR